MQWHGILFWAAKMEKDENGRAAMNAVVSIIMPAYNVEKYIRDTLESVKNQTYGEWECIVADDFSNDSTGSIIKEYCQNDARFQYIRLEKNCGAAVARNAAIDKAKGKYLAFLDSDDIWRPEKLESQLRFMEENEYDFTCTSYGKIDENGNIQSKVIEVKQQYDYSEVLKNCPGNSTVIYNCDKLGKIYAEDIKRRNDFAMWLKIIKITSAAYGLNEILTYHRERKDSISFKKTALIKYQWKVYRGIEKLSVVRSIYLVLYKIMKGIASKFKII